MPGAEPSVRVNLVPFILAEDLIAPVTSSATAGDELLIPTLDAEVST